MCVYHCIKTPCAIFFSSMYICIWYVHVCVHMYALACGGQRLIFAVFFGQPLPFLSKQSLSLNLKTH